MPKVKSALRLKYTVLSAVNANIAMIIAVDQLKGMSHTDVHNISIGRYCLAIPQARCLKLYVWMVRTVTFLATPSYCAETGMAVSYGTALFGVLCLGVAEFTWAEGSSYSSGVGIT